MRIAFTTSGTHWQSKIDPRFGRTEYIGIYDDKTDDLEFIDNRLTTGENHGAGTKTAKLLFDLSPDVLITGNGPGSNAAVVLDTLSLEIYTGAGEMTVKEAYSAYKENQLTKAS